MVWSFRARAGAAPLKLEFLQRDGEIVGHSAPARARPR